MSGSASLSPGARLTGTLDEGVLSVGSVGFCTHRWYSTTSVAASTMTTARMMATTMIIFSLFFRLPCAGFFFCVRRGLSLWLFGCCVIAGFLSDKIHRLPVYYDVRFCPVPPSPGWPAGRP